MRRVPVGL
jgi:hypothetical protein